ncbi:MAG: hypothetical protein EXS15_07840 [Phycisphaerales bacterium]|nr:hypothetical protein [Phycisphaerales bacterium]
MTLRKSIICPACWREFPPGMVKFIATSERFQADPIAGPGEPLRFRAMRFDSLGNALDPGDSRCSGIACPHCHSEFPRVLLELPPMPISIVGAPGSGKTNLLASGLWRMAQRAADLGCSITDPEPRFNTIVHRNEDMLFSADRVDSDVTLPKTDVGGAELYRTVHINGTSEMAPRPAFFVVGIGSEPKSVLVLYDNAGEHFMPGSRIAGSDSATRHLERSVVIIVVFDPLQDRRFRQRFAPHAVGVGMDGHQRQELVFSEAIAKVRRLRSLSPSDPIDIPIIVALTKADVWGMSALGDSWAKVQGASAKALSSSEVLAQLKCVSDAARAAVSSVASEFTNTVKSQASNSWFVPVSALGTSPEMRDGRYVISAGSIRPCWSEMPFVLAMYLAGSRASPSGAVVD